ncbi:HD-GYP domain-containing protein [Alteromonas halophila]|uniref:Phosphodiesterase n=1 Tax=Alteromonas halophila TaxID=516698 RepID=A0A918MUC0_9ALTE|nr:HD domain-containing phosphohydrolase [Alteromonas halophila]GGW72716.1 phosphodiesterase [Alteromonas halophila]
MLKQVSIDELVPGMYVSQVLEQTGQLRMRSKGLVKSASVIESLKAKGILTVEIDLDKSRLPEQKSAPAPEDTIEDTKPSPQPHRSNQEKFSQANDLYEQAVSIQSGFIKSLSTNAPKDLSPLTELSQSLIDSVFDNQDALSCLTMIKDADAYLLEHSINCSVMMGIFTQHLGYDRDTIEQASLGAMLMDIGMSALPQELRMSTDNLSGDDWAIVQSHVELGLELLEQCGDISDLVLHIIEQHHERVDGSGYPRRLRGDAIEPLARAAAIVDSYDAMTSNRPHREAITPSQALKRLTKQANLDQELVKQFIQCVGVHPIGSLVRLASGKLGIVCQAGTKDVLSPTVMTFYSVNSGGGYREIKRVDLSLTDDEIVSGVRPDDFNIDLPKFFREVFIHQVPG